MLSVLVACAGEPPGDARVALARQSLQEARALVGLDVVAARGFDGSGITVAVIDSGIDRTHPDLAGAVIDEACFCSSGVSGCCPGGTTTALGPGSAADDHGHGTHVAGVIASQGSQSPRGGAPGVKLVAVKVLSSTLGFCCMQDLIDALDWLAREHPEVRLVNLSLGTMSLYAGDCDVLYSALGTSLDALRASGVLVVAASGNDRSSTTLAAPACMSSVLSVGAVWDADVGPQSTYCTEVGTAADQIACFSNASASLDLLAPGGMIESTWKGGGTQLHAGTSQAAPMVTACAASLLQADPSLRADSLETLLEATGKPLLDPRNARSYPRIDCAAALAARVPLPPEPNPDADAGADDDAGSELADAGTVPPSPDAGPIDAGAAGSAGAQAASGGTGQAGSAAASGGDAAPIGPAEDAASAADDAALAGGASAGRDGSTAEPDAAIGRDGGRPVVVEVRGGGCDCTVAGAGERPRVRGLAASGWLGLALGGLYARARRRRRSASASPAAHSSAQG